MSKIAFVVPRYGSEVVGGAETLVRAFANRLPTDRFEVEVLSTCAIDHHTWANALPEGETIEGGVRVRRFRVSPRDVAGFLEIQERIDVGVPLGLEEELAWVRGSVNSERLYGHLEREGSRYDAILFAPYLFGTTLLGSQIHPDRSVLIPCLHDEGFARLAIVANALRQARGLVFNTEPEAALARRLHGPLPPHGIVGMGFDDTDALEASDFAARHGLDGDYVLYFGRKEGGKNLPLLLEGFELAHRADPTLRLVVAGSGSIDSPPAGVLDLEPLGERDKREAVAGALALCQPSTNESFSIVIMEAWLESSPVLVHGHCPVTREHVRAAGGGLYFTDPEELAAEIAWLAANREEARRLGESGRRYVRDEYAWPRVLERFDATLERIFATEAA